MGFTIVGPNQFLGSGHPDPREELPPYLGLIRSQDGGESWDPVSLLGDSDFHVLEAAGDTVYGFGSDFDTRKPQLLVSTDGGSSWQKRPLPERPSGGGLQEAIVALAIDPEDPDRIVVSGQQALWTSSDQGRHWKFLSADSGLLVWPDRDTMYLADAQGSVKKSTDGGRSWKDVGSPGGSPAAFEAAENSLLVALHDDGRIMQSEDAGETWQVRSRP